MANALRGEASFGDRTLRFDINALCEAEEALGKTTAEILQEMQGDISTRTLRGLIWAGLQRSNPCTIHEAGDMVTEDPAAARAALFKALTAAYGGGSGTANPPTEAQ